MAPTFLDHPVPFGFAHQGGTDVAPGNTVAAFDHAVALGYRYLEMDLHATSDGVLVVFHDDDMAPTTGIAGPIESKTWDEVSRLRAGGTHPIPRFDEIVARYPHVRLNVDPKHDTAVAPLIEAVRSGDLIDRIGIGSFSDRRIRQVRQALGPGVCTSPGPLGMGLILMAALFRPSWRPPHAMLQIPRRYSVVPLVNRFLLDRYHRMGLQVHVWTVNDEIEMAELLDLGVDAIMTDAVGALRRVLEARGAWPATGDRPPDDERGLGGTPSKQAEQDDR